MRDPKERLRDILEAIAAIERYRDQDRAAFEQDLPQLKPAVEAFLKRLEELGYGG